MKQVKKLELISILLFILCVSCTQKKQYYEESGTVFHTIYHIKYQADKLLTDKIDAELQAFNLSLNPFNKNSIIAKVNRNEDVEVDEWFSTVFNKAEEVSKNSDGVFDVTAAPLFNLWGFGFEHKDSVSQEAIDSIKEFVGYNKIHLKDKHVIKDDQRMELNFSAIAKGFASDVIAALLEREGVENYMIEIGGEITLKGKNPKGDSWQIGINKPEDDSTGMKNDIEDIVCLSNKCGLATSGNYRNFYIKDGKKYAHTIDPRTGYPAEQSILSATIVAPDCVTADAYATAFMAMGIDSACKMAERVPEIEYYLIYEDADSCLKIKCSDNFKQFIKK